MGSDAGMVGAFFYASASCSSYSSSCSIDEWQSVSERLSRVVSAAELILSLGSDAGVVRAFFKLRKMNL
jgi:hypothetical protein